MQCNIYFGTIGKKLGVRYQFTRTVKSIEDAKTIAEDSAKSLYFKYEGQHGIPSYNQISKESELTGVSIETLYNDHMKDMLRWYVIPTEVDTIPRRKLRW